MKNMFLAAIIVAATLAPSAAWAAKSPATTKSQVCAYLFGPVDNKLPIGYEIRSYIRFTIAFTIGCTFG